MWSQGEGGGSPSEAYAVQAMLEAGFDVTHLSPIAPNLKSSEGSKGVRFVRITNPFQSYHYLLRTGIAFLYRLPAVTAWTRVVSSWLVKSGESFDLVVAHSSESIFAMRRCASYLGVPSISRLYGISAPIQRLEKGLRRELYFDLISLLRNPPDILILTNDGTCGEEVCGLFGIPSNRYHFLFNGYEPSLLTLDVTESVPPYILTACRLVDWKRVDRVIHVAAFLRSKLPDLQFVILGDGPERQTLEKLIKRLDLSRTVQLKGMLPRSTMYNYLARATAVLATQDLSNLNNTVLESLILGKPVVTLNTGCTDQLVRHEETGLLFEPDDLEGAAQVITKLIDDGNFRRTLGKRAKALSRTRLKPWPERIEEEARIYRKFI